MQLCHGPELNTYSSHHDQFSYCYQHGVLQLHYLLSRFPGFPSVLGASPRSQRAPASSTHTTPTPLSTNKLNCFCCCSLRAGWERRERRREGGANLTVNSCGPWYRDVSVLGTPYIPVLTAPLIPTLMQHDTHSASCHYQQKHDTIKN